MAPRNKTFDDPTVVRPPERPNITYTFHNHFHPYVGELIKNLNHGEIRKLMASDTEIEPEAFFRTTYDINPAEQEIPAINRTIAAKGFPKEIELNEDGAYSIYNWELFFHIPLTIAVQLSKNQRYAEAQRWFHLIFDPTTDEPEDPANPTARYWKFRHFKDHADAEQITTLLETLHLPDTDNEEINAVRRRLRDSITAWRDNPFRPHQVAKFRPLAYRSNVVMKYLDNLIAWGDSLFRQFTIESLNVATQLYVIAANILGDRPQEIPSLNKRPVRTYKELKNNLKEFGNAMVEMESEFPLNSNIPGPDGGSSDASRTGSLLGMTKQLYFCIPKNNNLLTYWDTVADRLFKIRHCMDIEGNARQLPLFQPAIDPGMLVKAVAAGMDLSSIVGGLNQPLSNVRFPVIMQKALELCNEVKAMGSALLSAIEKGDAEKLALIRQAHEIKILELAQDVRYLQWKEAEASTEALLKTRESAYQRYRHYQLVLGMEEGDFSDLEDLTIERKEITEENFAEVYGEFVEKYGAEVDIEEYREEKLGLLGEAASQVSSLTGSVDSALGVGSSEHLQLNKTEDIDLNVFMPLATTLNLFSGSVGAVATVLSLIPQFDASGRPLGVGAGTGFGGRQLSAAASFASQLIRLGGDIVSYQGARASKLGAYQRRVDEWVLQNNLASKELQQIGRQVIGALIREQIAKKEYENHKTQLEQSRTIDAFLKEQKYSNEELYLWMQGEISKMYYDWYQFAFDTAKKAEVTMKYELMRKELDERDFIKFNYWDAGRKGLLSGEALYLDLKRMELAYLESNKREFEITKNISLRQLNPLALLQLKVTGSCEIEIPEWLVDLDGPGHYMRRIKTVGVSIPCVAGPYTSISCTLSLLKSTVRTSPLLSEGAYARQENEDKRFRDYYGTIQSIVTSNAQNDNGLFEVNLRDDRYLPFEGAGACSTWKIELPSDLKQFDYHTITDVIIHMRYTARQGGDQLKDGAVAQINEIVNDAQRSGLVRLFSLKHDFPNEWHQFHASEGGDLTLAIKKEHFPYFAQGRVITIADNTSSDAENRGVTLYNDDFSAIPDTFDADYSGIELDDPTTEREITINGSAIRSKENVFLVLSYAIG